MAKLAARLPIIKLQPSISTNNINLNGIEIIIGDNIIIPMDIKTLATTISIPKKIKQNNSKLNDSNDKVLHVTPHKNSDAYERANQNSKKNNFLEPKKINPPEKSTLLDEKLNKFTELSSIKQTENLLSFAKQIRGTLNQSINKTHRTL